MVQLPTPFCDIAYHRLGYSHASPIHALPNLTKQLSSAKAAGTSTVKLWCKREDQAGALACYGNKYRKFEYIIPDILATKDVTTIVSEGALQSNHTVQVAGMSKLLGLKCTILLHRGIGGLRQAEDKDAYARVGNVHLNRILGAQIHITEECDTGDETGPLLPVLDDLRAKGEVPYWISSGASLHPLGGLGYARCAFEIALQEQELCESGSLQGHPYFDHIFVAVGSGSTFAGLVAGFRLLQKTGLEDGATVPRRIIGVMTSPTRSKAYQEERLLKLARMAGRLIGLDPVHDLTEADIHLDDQFTGLGYGITDGGLVNTIDHAAQTDSLMLDPVYTAKVFQGMWNWGTNYQEPSNALFLHTGGQTALSAYADPWTRMHS